MLKKYLYIALACIIVLVIVVMTVRLAHKRKDKHFITLFGNVDVRQVDLGFRVLGRVVTMPFQEGDFVPKGAFMGAMEEKPYTDQVTEAEGSIESIKAELLNAEEIFQRRAELISEGGVSREDYETALATRDSLTANLKQAEAALLVAQKNLADTRVYAPTDGTILTRIREPGSVVNPGEPIYTLSVLSPVWVRAFVPEPELGNIYYGMPARVYTDTKGGPVYDGHIGFISPVAEFTPKTVETTQLRTDLVYRLRIIAENPDRYFKQGMPVTVKLQREKEVGSSSFKKYQ
ncbi:MAG TPA: efflux RND transporter periplasmic adaptor subunit [Chlamydiales bacterium]|nr:efflux RND transporter periplasmic adaptor subunit [Chlamydiales bacterium]